MQAVTDDRLALFAEMESKYEQKDTEYFVSLLDHPDYVVRTRVACILVDFGGEDKVPYIAKVLKNDEKATQLKSKTIKGDFLDNF